MDGIAKVALGIVGGYLLYELYTLWAVQQLSFSLASFNFSPSGVDGTVTLDISVKNPTANDYTLQGVNVGVTVNGTFIGTVTNSFSQDVPAHSVQPITVTMNITDLGLITALLNWLTGTGAVMVNLNGVATLNNLTFPMNINFKAL